MTKSLPHRLVTVALATALPAALFCWKAQAAPTAGGTRLAARPEEKKAVLPPAPPDYLPMGEIQKLLSKRDNNRLPVLMPTMDGEVIKQPMRDLMTDPSHDFSTKNTLVAQVTPRRPRLPSLPPAPIGATRPPARDANKIPRWVHFPLEFQLCGIGLGTKAVDKVKGDYIDRYGLFAMHGNPTAVVVPSATGTGITISQQPPEVSALFPANEGGGLPAWAAAITVALDNNHVEWLYRRDTYSMGFVVDRLGFVDAIVVAGVHSPIAKTQLEDPLHTVQLGDDLRKVFFRYGYPDTLETYNINAVAGVSTVAETGAAAPAAPDAGGAAAPPAGAAPGGEGAPAAGATGNGPGSAAFRTFEVRYEQSYNVVFTIRNNRVVRILIFGDPDFFNYKDSSGLTRRERLRRFNPDR